MSERICDNVLIWRCGCAGFDCLSSTGEHLVLKSCDRHSKEGGGWWRDMSGASLEEDAVGARLCFVGYVAMLMSDGMKFRTIKRLIE